MSTRLPFPHKSAVLQCDERTFRREVLAAEMPRGLRDEDQPRCGVSFPYVFGLSNCFSSVCTQFLSVAAFWVLSPILAFFNVTSELVS